MLRVLIVEYGAGFGGAVVSASELAQALASRGDVSPIVVTSHTEETLDGLLGGVKHVRFSRLFTYRTKFALESWLRRRSIGIMLRPVVIGAYTLLDFALELLNSVRLLRIIKRNRIDIVHVNNGWADDAIRAAHLAKCAAVIHCRGIQDHRILRTGRRRRWLASTVTTAIAISESVAQSVIDWGLPASMVKIVYNPIKLDRYAAGRRFRNATRRKLGFHDSHVVVAIFGRFTAWKGQVEFLRSVADVVEQCPKLRVMLVGDESDSADQGYGALVRQTAEAQLPGLVMFTGFQSQVQDYYWAADIVVHNSTEPEPFGRVISEAMACERVVVAMDEGGPKEIVTDHVDGLLVSPRDRAALSDAILMLYSESSLRARLGEAAAATVKRRFDGVEIASQMLSIYRNALTLHDIKRLRAKHSERDAARGEAN